MANNFSQLAKKSKANNTIEKVSKEQAGTPSLEIYKLGDDVLRENAKRISKVDNSIRILAKEMLQSMYAAKGIGLAAPQINKSIRLFLIDTAPFFEDQENSNNDAIKKVFINPRIIEEKGDDWDFNEGCLSIPDIREDVIRKALVTIEYFDENFEKHTDVFDGLNARVIQHEYDHINGVLFVDKISPLRKRMIKGKLMDISKGKVNAAYKMRFAR